MIKCIHIYMLLKDPKVPLHNFTVFCSLMLLVNYYKSLQMRIVSLHQNILCQPALYCVVLFVHSCMRFAYTLVSSHSAMYSVS
jgi:hypothetical protein